MACKIQVALVPSKLISLPRDGASDSPLGLYRALHNEPSQTFFRKESTETNTRTILLSMIDREPLSNRMDALSLLGYPHRFYNRQGDWTKSRLSQDSFYLLGWNAVAKLIRARSVSSVPS